MQCNNLFAHFHHEAISIDVVVVVVDFYSFFYSLLRLCLCVSIIIHSQPFTFIIILHSISDLGGNGTGLGTSTLAETVLETTGQILQMTHTASSGGLSSDTLGGPVVGTELGSGVAALSASLLLLVVSAVTAAFAEGVSLSMAFTKTGCSLGLFIQTRKSNSIT